MGPLLVRTFDWGGGQAARDRQLAQGSPVLAVVATAGDAPPDWIRTGQALSRVLLRARAAAVWGSYLNQAIEVAELRPKLQRVACVPGLPQLLLRMGYGPEPAPTPRRTVEEVLMRHSVR